jgi:hypothetical protein
MLEKSPLVPTKEGQLISIDDWYSHRSEECKWEYFGGKPFNLNHTYETDRILIMLLSSVGLKRFVNELLPKESKEILIEILKEEENARKNESEMDWQEQLRFEQGRRIARNLARNFTAFHEKYGLTIEGIEEVCEVNRSEFEDYIDVGGEME